MHVGLHPGRQVRGAFTMVLLRCCCALISQSCFPIFLRSHRRCSRQQPPNPQDPPAKRACSSAGRFIYFANGAHWRWGPWCSQQQHLEQQRTGRGSHETAHSAGGQGERAHLGTRLLCLSGQMCFSLNSDPRFIAPLSSHRLAL